MKQKLSMRNRNIANWILTQALWFICVLGGDLYAVVAGICYWFFYVTHIGNVQREWPSLVIIVSSGFIIDILLSSFGVINFNTNMFMPLWLLVIWSGFATLFHHGLGWLLAKPVLAAVLGAITGPLAYFAGAALSVSQINVSPTVFICIYAVLWSLYMPIFLFISSRFNRSESLSALMRL
jgi:hypothetical protein